MSTHYNDAPTPGSGRAPRRGLVAALVSSIVLVLTATLLAAPGAQARDASDRDVKTAQANIKTGIAAEKFQADTAEVFSENPDFVTWNEVPCRQDRFLAPAGYGLHRKAKKGSNGCSKGDGDRYTRATPVAWRTGRWTKFDEGTFRISGYRDVPDGRHTRIGLRYANWVSLRGLDGRKVSVVSVHVAPRFRDDDGKTVDLLRHSVKRLRKLADRLAPRGPVLVGGDFNVHYGTRRYPQRLFRSADLVPTYASVGRLEGGTHDRKDKYLIDYVFNRGKGVLRAEAHHKRELHSDHDAVVARLGWQTDAPADTRVTVSDPDDPDRRRDAAQAILRDLRHAKGGWAVDVVTRGATFFRGIKAMRSASDRGVHVRLLTKSRTLKPRERRLRRYLRHDGDPGSWVRRCDAACRDASRVQNISKTFVLVRDRRGRPVRRADANRVLNRNIVETRTRVVRRTGAYGLAEGLERMRALR